MSEKGSLEGKKILFVEDDEFFADIMTMKLKGSGCEVRHVADGDSVFPAISKEKPDVMILDIMLPGGMDGYAIIEKLKADPVNGKIPIIILSNLSREEDIEKGMKLGAFKYMTKAHVTPNDVVGSLQEAIASVH